ncbi:MAG: CapA family protein [Patescibacteria group bacterium]
MRLKQFLQFGVFGVIVVLVMVGVFYISTNKTTPSIISFVEKKMVSVVKEKKIEAVIVSVGDIFMHDNNLSAAYDRETKKYNFDSVFSVTNNYFKEADISTAWLGAVYSPTGPYSGYPLFKSPIELIDALQNIGLDVAFRTNHTMDFGTKGLNVITQILKDHKINQVAAYSSEEDSRNIHVYQKDDLKIAFLGYVYGMNGLPIPEPWMINLINMEKIKVDIVKAKTQADFVVVALHFGTEYERSPNKWQEETAQQVADFGADLIIGSHPHVIQPADRIIAKDGRKVFVAYGLGNFYCGQREQYTDAGMILRYTIEKVDGKAALKDVSYVPTWVAQYKENGKTQFKVLPSKEYIKLYDEKQAAFLSVANYNRLKQTYQETVKHLDNPVIGFVEYEK